MKSVVIIETASTLELLIEDARKSSTIAIDTESNGFYAYYERLCLLQISTSVRDYIVDPLALDNLAAVGELLADPSIEKVFHAASNDVVGLRRDFHFSVQNLFDTAIACKMLGYQQLGLAKILQEHFGVVLNKRLQRHDWGLRPLTPEQIDYARLDTHYLVPLRHRLAAELQTRELWEQAQECFQKASEQEAAPRMFRPDEFLRINGARTLDPIGKRILKALYLFREKEARRRNRAPFRILSAETLLHLAHLRPKSVKDFSKIKGMPRSYQDRRAAHVLLDIIRRTEASQKTSQPTQ